MTPVAPQWASPGTSSQIRRSQYLSDALKQMQASRTPDSYRTGTATLANTLSDAVLGYARNNAEEKADAAIAADKTKLSDAIRGMFPDPAASGGAMDLTPGAVGQTADTLQTTAKNPQYAQLADLIFQSTGDPTAAINAGFGRQRQDVEDQRYKDERAYSRGRDQRGDYVQDRGFNYQVGRDATTDNQWQQGFDRGGEQFAITSGMTQQQIDEAKRHNRASEANDAERAAAAAKAATAAKPEDVGQLRKEYNSQATPFVNVRDAYSRLTAAGEAKTPAQQMSLVFSYMKMLDPTSAVRETEYANAENARGVPVAIQNLWNKVKDGQFLAPSQVEDFRKQAADLYKGAEDNYARTHDFYRQQAVDAGMSPDVIQDFRLPAEQSATAAAPQMFTGADGKQYSRDEATKVRNFFATLPPGLRDEGLISQLDSLLSDNGGATKAPSTEDLMKKYGVK